MAGGSKMWTACGEWELDFVLGILVLLGLKLQLGDVFIAAVKSLMHSAEVTL